MNERHAIGKKNERCLFQDDRNERIPALDYR